MPEVDRTAWRTWLISPGCVTTAVMLVATGWMMSSREPLADPDVLSLGVGVWITASLWMSSNLVRDMLPSRARIVLALISAPLIAAVVMGSSMIYAHFGELLAYGMLRYTGATGPQTALGFVWTYPSWWHWAGLLGLSVALGGLWASAPRLPLRPRQRRRGLALGLVALGLGLGVAHTERLGPRSTIDGALLTATLGAALAPEAAPMPRQPPASLEEVSPETGAPRPDILFVLNESWGRQRLSAYGYERETMPRWMAWFERQGRRGVVAQQAFTTSTTTRLSVLAQLTGIGPHRPLSALAEAPPLWSWAERAGYHTVLVTSQCYRWSQMQDFVERAPPERWLGCDQIEAPLVNDAGIDELVVADELDAVLERAPSDQPLLLVYNTNALHRPFQHSSQAVDEPIAPERPDYERALAVLDRALARLLEAARSSGRLEQAVVILTSDHGARQQRRHRPPRVNSYYDEFTHIPMMWRLPPELARQRPEQLEALRRNARERNVSTLDIAPTLLEWMGLDPRECRACPGLDGHRLTRDLPAERPLFVLNVNAMRRWHHEGFAVIQGPWRLMYSTLEGPQLFDVRRSPHLEENLWRQAPARRRELLGIVARTPALRRIWEDYRGELDVEEASSAEEGASSSSTRTAL